MWKRLFVYAGKMSMAELSMKTNIKKNNSEQKSMEKNQKIQVVRGIAVIAVVLIHTCPLGMYQVIARQLINFCVSTFLFFPDI